MLVVWFLLGIRGAPCASHRVGGPLITCCARSIATALSAEGRLPSQSMAGQCVRVSLHGQAHRNGVWGWQGAPRCWLSHGGAATHRPRSTGAAVSWEHSLNPDPAGPSF